MSTALVMIAGAIFSGLGLLHGVYTLADLKRPRRFTPSDPNVQAQMAASTLRFSRGRATMWDVWMGFNLSHSLGAIVYGAVCIAVARLWSPIPTLAFGVLVLIAAIYEVLAIRFWFRTPAIGIALGMACLIIAWIVQVATSGLT